MAGGMLVIQYSARDTEKGVEKRVVPFNLSEEAAMRMLIAIFATLLLATGCTTLGSNTMSLATGEGKKEEVSIDPISFVGIQMTPAIVSGQYQAKLGTFPEEFFSEVHPFRFRYNAIAYGKNSGKEYPAQAMYAGYAQCALRLVFIVEGDVKEPIVGAFASTRFTRLFNLYGEEIAVEKPEKLISDAGYRKEIVLSGGTLASKLKNIPVSGKSGMQESINGWNTVRVKTLAHEIRTPLPENLVRIVARDNPEIAFPERLVGNGNFAVRLDWFGTAAGAVADVLVAANAASKGWDEDSELKRGQQGMIARVIKRQYDAAIRSGMSCTGPDVMRSSGK